MNSGSSHLGEDRIRRVFDGEFTSGRIRDLNDRLFRGIGEHPFVQSMDRLTDNELKLCIRACALLEDHPNFFGHQSAAMLFYLPKLMERVGCDGLQGVASIIGQTRNCNISLFVSVASDVVARIGVSGLRSVAEMATKLGWLGSKDSEYGGSYDFAGLFLNGLLSILEMEDHNKLERWGRIVEKLYVACVAHPVRHIITGLDISEMGQRIGLSGIEKMADLLVVASHRHSYDAEDLKEEDLERIMRRLRR